MSDYVHRVYDVSHEELGQDPHNANLGTERGNALVGKSLDLYGPGRAILLDRNNIPIAGNKTLQAAVERGLPVTVVESHGEALVAVKRLDLTLDDPEGKARGLALADNRTAEVNLSYDLDELQALADAGIAQEFFWDNELEELEVEVRNKRSDFASPIGDLPFEGDEQFTEGEESVSQGQVWVLGSHTLYVGEGSHIDEAAVMIRAWEKYTGLQAELRGFDEFG